MVDSSQNIPSSLVGCGSLFEKDNTVFFKCLCGAERKVADGKRFGNAVKHVSECAWRKKEGI